MMFSSPECITWFAVGLTESVAIVTVNLATIIIFMRNSNLRKRNMYLVINLAVADMLVGGLSTLQLFFVPRKMQCNFLKLDSSLKVGTVGFILFLFPLTSLTNTAVISLERLHATFRPFRHRVIEKWVYKIVIAVVWILAAVVSTALVTISLIVKSPWSHHFYLWQSFNCFCLLTICVCYTSIIVKIYCGAHPQHHGAADRERKLTVTLFIVTLVSLLMWLPYVISSLLFFTTDSFKTLSKLKTSRLNYPLIVLFYANSFVNPILYAIRMPGFKTALVSLFRRQQRQIEVFPLYPL